MEGAYGAGDCLERGGLNDGLVNGEFRGCRDVCIHASL